jgi:hypothetical protein
LKGGRFWAVFWGIWALSLILAFNPVLRFSKSWLILRSSLSGVLGLLMVFSGCPEFWPILVLMVSGSLKSWLIFKILGMKILAAPPLPAGISLLIIKTYK